MYLPLFRMANDDARKDKDGNVTNWEANRTSVKPRSVAEPRSYINAEKGNLNLLRDRMIEAELQLVG